MNKHRKAVFFATVLSGVLLAGLLLVFWLSGSGRPDFPGAKITPSQAATPTSANLLSSNATPTPGISPTLTAAPTVPGTAMNKWQDPAIHILSVGEGSSALVCCYDTAILIDGGDAPTSAYVVSYLQKLGIKHLSMVIATHYDSDHISGLVGVLSVLSVDNIYGPSGSVSTKTYESFCNMVEAKNIPRHEPIPGEIYRTPNDITVEFLSTDKVEDTDPTDDQGRDASLAMVITIRGRKILIMGDAGAAKERRLVRDGRIPDVDIFLVNHHGSRYSNTGELLVAANPEFAVISCGTNDYGHPAYESIARLTECRAKIFRTDVQGTVVLSFENNEIRPNVPALEDPYADPDDGDVVAKTETPEDVTFILNGNSKVYHLPDCDSVSGEMHRNWFYFYGAAEEAEALGYRPCGRCLGK
ncbi:MAG: MBL fold metallo-hydrolase [Lachnospiraceae bacterium]|nr:MBL fold metallo-hydrolase [Lachnospiraceae bacterium]